MAKASRPSIFERFVQSFDEHIPGPNPDDQLASSLEKDLKGYHSQLIALGSAIGTGLFIASGEGLALAGPIPLLAAFCFVGVTLCPTVFALGEMATLFSKPGGFFEHCRMYTDNAWGGAMGWKYVLACGSPSTADKDQLCHWMANYSPSRTSGFFDNAGILGKSTWESCCLGDYFPCLHCGYQSLGSEEVRRFRSWVQCHEGGSNHWIHVSAKVIRRKALLTSTIEYLASSAMWDSVFTDKLLVPCIGTNQERRIMDGMGSALS